MLFGSRRISLVLPIFLQGFPGVREGKCAAALLGRSEVELMIASA